ncbi:hypothetical protein ACJW31_01G168700 [Castanea mollissima]
MIHCLRKITRFELMVWSKEFFSQLMLTTERLQRLSRSLRTETPIKSLGTIIGISTCRLVPNFQPCQFGRLWSLVTKCFSMPRDQLHGTCKEKRRGLLQYTKDFSVQFSNT